MGLFKSYLEESGQLPKILLHPTKGLYSVHKNGQYHYVKNKFGEVAHTFFNHKDDEVLDKLKNDHDLENLMERSNSSEININRGSYNEAMFAKHLNGGKWIDKDHETFANHHKSILDAVSPGESDIQERRAKAQVSSFLEHAKSNGYDGVKGVHLTQKPGDIKKHTGMDVSQQENPSDVVVHFKNKPKDKPHGFLGASLKSSSSKAIGFHNGGAKVIGKSLGLKLGETGNARQKEFMEKFKLSPKLTHAESEIKGEKGTEEYRNNPLYHEAMKHAAGVNTEIRDTLHDHYSNMDQDEVKHHLLKTYIKANAEHTLPYVKTHGTGGDKKEASAHTEDPSDNEVYHQLRNAKHIEFKKGGGSLIHVHADGKRVFGIQVKHNNGPLTPLKILAQP
jgi:hypothetical protein